MPVRPEDFGGVKIGAKGGVSPEDFGGVAVDQVSADEEGGMIMPTKEQLKRREGRKRWDLIREGEVPENATTSEALIAGLYRTPIGSMLNLASRGNVPAWMRAGESIKMTPRGKAGYLASVLQGEQAPVSGPEGPMVYDPQVGEHVPVNRPGADSGDIAALAGPAIEAVPNIAATIAAPQAMSNPAAQGAVAAGGNILRQGVSGMLPGEDYASFLERVGAAGEAGLWAGGTQLGINALTRGADYVRPTNIIGRKYQNALQTEQGRQGSAIANRTGATMDIAEETLDPALLRYRNTALQSDEGQNLARDMNNRQLAEQRKLSEKIAQQGRRNVTVARIDAKQTADAIEGVTEKELDKLYKARSSNADVNFNAVRDAVKVNVPGGKVDVEVSGLKKVLAEEEENFPGITKSIREGKRFFKVTDRGPKFEFADIEDVLRLEQRLRAVKSKKGSLNPHYDAGQNKQVAGRLHDALVSDLQKIERQVGQDVYSKLKSAIGAYKADSDAIREVAKLKLGDASTPEGLAETFRTAQPSQVKRLLELADDHDPSLRRKAVAYVFRSGIDKAKSRVLSPSGQVPFNRQTFLNEIGIGEEKLHMLTRGDRAGRQAVDDVIELVKRTSKSTNVGNASANVGSDVASGTMVATNILAGDPKAGLLWGGKFLAKHLTGPLIAKIMLNPEGQQVLRTLVKTNPGSKAYAGALSYIARVALKEPTDKEIAEELPPMQ